MIFGTTDFVQMNESCWNKIISVKIAKLITTLLCANKRLILNRIINVK